MGPKNCPRCNSPAKSISTNGIVYNCGAFWYDTDKALAVACRAPKKEKKKFVDPRFAKKAEEEE